MGTMERSCELTDPQESKGYQDNCSPKHYVGVRVQLFEEIVFNATHVLEDNGYMGLKGCNNALSSLN